MTTANAPRGARRRARAVKLPADLREQDRDEPLNRHWRFYFLTELAATSNVTAAAKAADVTTWRAYKTRREDPDFARKWRGALAEGYENLEMELLGYLRAPDGKPKMDVVNAIRLMAMHRDEVARFRAVEDDRSEEEVRASLKRKLDLMRQRSAENSAILALYRHERPSDGSEGRE